MLHKKSRVGAAFIDLVFLYMVTFLLAVKIKHTSRSFEQNQEDLEHHHEFVFRLVPLEPAGLSLNEMNWKRFLLL